MTIGSLRWLCWLPFVGAETALAGPSAARRPWIWLKKKSTYGVCGAVIPPEAEDRRTYHEKETHFWTPRHTKTAYPNTASLAPADAARQFTALYPASKLRSECPNGFVEGTPDNIRSAEAPRLLRAALPLPFRPELRFVAVLREPVARDLSAYNHQNRLATSWCAACPPGGRNGTYEAYANCRLETKRKCEQGLDIGFYEAQLRAWAAAFSRRQIAVFEFGWLLANKADAERRIGGFLRFPTLRGAANFPLANKSERDDGTQPPQKTIRCHVRDRLEAAYAPENEKLYAYLAATRGPAEEPPFPRFERMPCVVRAREHGGRE
ncbi:hypothetical protein JL722_2550 [Aureococcus anophagefferens]|nr:hypothetical protein JL722_2550 [Aureococcus anophagefferens]